MDNELIKLITNDGRQLVSARELYDFLEIRTKFYRWFDRMCEYGFNKNDDYIKVSQKRPTNGGMQTITDYAISLDMAKEISMIQRSEKGKQARLYFIECEKKLREIEKQPQLNPEKELVWKVYEGGIDAITAHKELLALETKELNDKIEVQQDKIEEQQGTIEEQKPFVAIAKERIVKGECVSLTDVTKGLNLKKGQISVWAKNNGLLSKVGTEVNKKGEEYFKIYIDKKGFKCIGIKEKGIDLINNNLEDIKNSPCRMSKK